MGTVGTTHNKTFSNYNFHSYCLYFISQPICWHPWFAVVCRNRFFLFFMYPTLIKANSIMYSIRFGGIWDSIVSFSLPPWIPSLFLDISCSLFLSVVYFCMLCLFISFICLFPLCHFCADFKVVSCYYFCSRFCFKFWFFLGVRCHNQVIGIE